jgi:Tfp pilus assembly protein PilN
MRAVNLMPADSSRGGSIQLSSFGRGPGAIVVGVLAVVLGLVTFMVLTQNTISSNTATLARDRAELASVQTQAASLSRYQQFAQLAQTRVQTIRQIASSRFDWQSALNDLAKVVPANTSLQSLTGSVSPGVSAGGSTSGNSSGVGAGTLRSDIGSPALELSGCTNTQDDVARLMSRLRVMPGVTRVTLADSQKPAGASSGGAAGSGTSGGCGQNGPSFDLVVFFQALPGSSSTTSGAAG